MKVNLQQSIDIEEVPFKIDGMYKVEIEKLQLLCDLAQSLDVLQPEKFISQIDFIRQKLFSIDDAMAECSSLMVSYKAAHDKISQLQAAVPEDSDVQK